jgi:hypothetical protein
VEYNAKEEKAELSVRGCGGAAGKSLMVGSLKPIFDQHVGLDFLVCGNARLTGIRATAFALLFMRAQCFGGFESITTV